MPKNQNELPIKRNKLDAFALSAAKKAKQTPSIKVPTIQSRALECKSSGNDR
jgi:hypothetical protein